MLRRTTDVEEGPRKGKSRRGGTSSGSRFVRNISSWSTSQWADVTPIIILEWLKNVTFGEVLAQFPDLIERGLTLAGRQVTRFGRRMDLLFADARGGTLLAELKWGPIKDEHIGQLMSYEGMLLSHDDAHDQSDARRNAGTSQYPTNT